MGLLKTHRPGAYERGVMVGLTGQPGAGKTTLAATLPGPVLVLDAEGGGFVLEGQGGDVSVHDEFALRPKRRLDELLDLLHEIRATDYKTVVLDSWTRVSEWIEADILEEDGKAESLMNACGGYGKGRDAHVSRTAMLLESLKVLQEAERKHIVWILHTKIGQVDLPTGEAFSYFGNEGVKDSTKRVLMACDEVAMLRQHVQVVTKSGEKAGKARGKGERELFCGPYPYCDTKSRFIDEPTTIRVERGVNPFGHIFDRR